MRNCSFGCHAGDSSNLTLAFKYAQVIQLWGYLNCLWTVSGLSLDCLYTVSGLSLDCFRNVSRLSLVSEVSCFPMNVGLFLKKFWWNILMRHFDGTFWWEIWIRQLDKTFWWHIFNMLTGNFDETLWWDILMDFWWDNLMRHLDGWKWMDICA